MINKKIIRKASSVPPSEFLSSLHPILRQVFWSRNVRSGKDIEYDLKALPTIKDLSGIHEAAALLANCMLHEKHILIVADFDADGATSCAVAMRALRMMGAKAVSYLVPNRFEYGYGLTPEIVDLAAQQQPDLIVTVDNGISSIEGVARAKAHGIKVVVTDHHLPGETLPDADAIVNPNLPGEVFQGQNLAGVGVIFYVMLALRQLLRESKWFSEKDLPVPNMANLLDLVALGTVADVVPLDRLNRIFVEQGLQRIRAEKCVPGILALLKIAGREPSRLVASDLGFAIGPRLNAAGRLDDMTLGIECLLGDTWDRAAPIAQSLDELNTERRAIEVTMKADAQQQVSSLIEGMATGKLPHTFSLFQQDWHQGIVGIVAARIKEHFHRPVVAFAEENDDTLKGSARSISGLHIRDVFADINTQCPDLIIKFGGHAMAAGLSIRRKDLERFTALFEAAVLAKSKPNMFDAVIESDGELDGKDLSLSFAKTLQASGPWGQGFPEPVFDGIFDIVEKRVLKEKHLKLSLSKDGGAPIDGIMFNALDHYDLPESRQLRIAYRLDINAFRGVERPQLMISHYEVA